MKSQTGEAALLGGVRGLLGGLRGWQLFWDTRAMERGRRLVLKNKAKEEVSGERPGAAEIASPGLVRARQLALERKSRCRVSIRRRKAPGACKAARPTTQQTSRSGRGGRAAGSTWAASPACP